jgi:hypothetical protein
MDSKSEEESSEEEGSEEEGSEEEEEDNDEEGEGGAGDGTELATPVVETGLATPSHSSVPEVDRIRTPGLLDS